VRGFVSDSWPFLYYNDITRRHVYTLNIAMLLIKASCKEQHSVIRYPSQTQMPFILICIQCRNRTVIELQKNKCGGPLYPSFLQQHGTYGVVKISEGPGKLWLPCNSNTGTGQDRTKPLPVCLWSQILILSCSSIWHIFMEQRWMHHNLGSKGQRSRSQWNKVWWKQHFLGLLAWCIEKH